MRSASGRIAILVLAVVLVPASHASATAFRGFAVGDHEMGVTIRVSKAGVVAFDYANVLVTCSNGDELRQPGGRHSMMLGEASRFSDTIEQEVRSATATSQVQGRVRGGRARGSVSYDLVYEGGQCHSGEVLWRAKRK
jgi:hypothetical protein